MPLAQVPGQSIGALVGLQDRRGRLSFRLVVALVCALVLQSVGPASAESDVSPEAPSATASANDAGSEDPRDQVTSPGSEERGSQRGAYEKGLAGKQLGEE
jgi:hypothetical protein